MKVLITGITGFAGSHLADYILHDKPGIEVYGIIRWRSRMDNILHIQNKVKLLEADLRDASSVLEANRMHAWISSRARPLYSVVISSIVEPCAMRRRTNATVKRVPLITGFPAIILGLRVIRSSSS